MPTDVIDEGDDVIVSRPIPRETIRSVETGILVTCNDNCCQWQGLFPSAQLAERAVKRHWDHESHSDEYHYGKRMYTIVALLD